MRNFKEWLISEEQGYQPVQSIQQAKQYAQTSGLNVDVEGLDRVAQVLKSGGEVWFTEAFPINELGRNRQGWTREHVLKMFQTFAEKLGVDSPASLEEVSQMGIDQKQFNAMISPVVISMMPDESYHIEDGNHRLGCAIVLKFPTVKAFVLKS